ncbi:hypothetical protein HJC23_008062 [Cyclotella cryptica]|uniref:WRKY transcription factor 19 n=1 Tax=Cyclotella cryptica TaxID=29204 RepID=A0ABD3NUL3_9STRA|eukprot:CCRYP_019791-RA/>CCRYP_019791-RA protein AED:0.33 eAED:0.33 QI:0/-1/0/1/-1/1/1/0/438
MSLERVSLSDLANHEQLPDSSSHILHDVAAAPSHVNENDACIESIVQEAIAMADAEHHEDDSPKTKTDMMDHCNSLKESTPSEASELGLRSHHHSKGIHSNLTNTEQFVSMSDIFALLRTAELESRLNPAKASRLRHVIMEGANGACQGGSCCWMNVVFGVLCELIPAPVYAIGGASAGSLAGVPNDDVVEKACRDSSSPTMHQFSVQPTLPESQPHSGSRCNEVSGRLTGESISQVKNSTLASSEMPASVEEQCKPCTESDNKSPPVSNNKSYPENDDAVAALLDMKMSSQDSSDTNLSTTKKRKASTSHPSSEGPHKIPTTGAIYPHPFSPLKNPTLYRRTRCKAPSCPNNGSACPYHGHDIKICKISECTNRAVQGGVCSKHGARRPLCRVEGCTNQSKREGRCIKHGAMLGGCGKEGCGNRARSGGLCRKHGAK